MTKYYNVYLYSLKDKVPYKYEVICTRVPFSNKLFKEIITDKIIYPYNPSKGLMYDHLNGGVREENLEKVETWLKSMNRDKILQHVERIQTIEAENLQYYEEMKKKLPKEKLQSKSISKSIKKTLRKIKSR